MAGTATISSNFVITVNPSNTAASTFNNPGRSFRVIGVAITNTTGGARNVKVEKGPSGDDVTQGGDYSAADNTTSWADLDTTNVDFAAHENIIVTCANAGVEVYILCSATGGGESLTAT
jgi:hypothetical protein